MHTGYTGFVGVGEISRKPKGDYIVGARREEQEEEEEEQEEEEEEEVRKEGRKMGGRERFHYPLLFRRSVMSY
jgi:hypothetical protein